MAQAAQPFAPSVDRHAAAGVRVTRQEYPVGVAGVHLSLEQIALRIREGSKDPDVRGWAGDQTHKAGLDGRSGGASVRQIVQCLLDAVRAQTVYAPDPVGTEYVVSAAATLCLRPGLCVRAADCFPAGTLLLRDDYELVPIEQIQPGDRIWGLDQWTTVVDKWSKGELPITTVELNNGSMVPLTEDHHVFVGDCPEHGHWKTQNPCACDWSKLKISRIKVSELKPKMRLPQPDRIPFGSQSMDPGRAYIEGLYVSEGWIDGSERRFSISGQDGCRKEALKHEVREICQRLGIETRWHRKSIAIKDAVWSKTLLELGCYGPEKRVRTLDLDEITAREMLRGVMSDSTANTNGPGRTFATTSEVLKTQVRVLQRMFGVSTNVHYLPPSLHKGFGKHPLWRMGVRKPKVKTDKRLRVRKIHRGTSTARCFDITTSDGKVYLPEHDVTVSNCDDLVVALGSAVMSLGIPVLITKQRYSVDDQEHVLLVAQDENGNWFPADPTHPTWPAGTMAPSRENVYVDPMAPNLAGVSGLPEAEFIGVGGLPRPSVREVLGLGAGPGTDSCGDSCCEEEATGVPCAECAAKVGVGDVDPFLGMTAVAAGPPPPAAAYTFDQATTDLQNQVAAVIASADTYLTSNEVANAIQAYQAAGQAGATSVGPEIDLSGRPNVTQPWTQQAWLLNQQLAAISSSSTSTTDAQSAQSLAKQMLALYQGAIAQGAGQSGVLQLPEQVILGTPERPVSAAHAAGWAIAAGLVGGLAWSYAMAPKALPSPQRRRRRR